jgi:predicted transcriptional regulator
MIDLARIKYQRKALELTQSQLAKQAGLSQSIIAKIESGRLDPTYSTVKKIEEALTRLQHIQEPEAKDFMTKTVISVTPETFRQEIIALFQKYKISQVPVIQNGIIIGMVTETNLIENEKETAKDMLTAPPPIVAPNTKKSVIISLLKQFPIVIITQGTKQIGVVTKSDILAKHF